MRVCVAGFSAEESDPESFKLPEFGTLYQMGTKLGSDTGFFHRGQGYHELAAVMLLVCHTLRVAASIFISNLEFSCPFPAKSSTPGMDGSWPSDAEEVAAGELRFVSLGPRGFRSCKIRMPIVLAGEHKACLGDREHAEEPCSLDKCSSTSPNNFLGHCGCLCVTVGARLLEIPGALEVFVVPDAQEPGKPSTSKKFPPPELWTLL